MLWNVVIAVEFLVLALMLDCYFVLCGCCGRDWKTERPSRERETEFVSVGRIERVGTRDETGCFMVLWVCVSSRVYGSVCMIVAKPGNKRKEQRRRKREQETERDREVCIRGAMQAYAVRDRCRGPVVGAVLTGSCMATWKMFYV